MFSILYKNFVLRFAASIFLSHIFTSFGHDKGAWEIINTDGYFAALMIGVLCCMLVSYIITETTARLNTFYSWKNNFLYRSLLQTLFGVVMPFGIILVLITIYFAVANIWIMDSYWPEHCAPYVFIALLFANGIAEMLKSTPIPLPILLTTAVADFEKEPAREKMFKGRPGSDIIFMWSVNRSIKLMFNDGTVIDFYRTLISTVALLEEGDYMFVNRAQVVKKSAIHKARYLFSNRKQVKLFLKNPDHREIIVSETITKDNWDFFKKFLAVDL